MKLKDILMGLFPSHRPEEVRSAISLNGKQYIYVNNNVVATLKRVNRKS